MDMEAGGEGGLSAANRPAACGVRKRHGKNARMPTRLMAWGGALGILLAGALGARTARADEQGSGAAVLAQQKEDDDDLLLPIRKDKGEKAPAKEDEDLLLPAVKGKVAAPEGETGEDDLLAPVKKSAGQTGVDAAAAWRGFVQGEAAYTVRDPQHWSKAKVIVELGRSGNLGGGVKWKVSARAYYDSVFALEGGFYPAAVRHDQRSQFQWRETYVDFAAGWLDFRIGRQHVVWGEMVTLFFADVVSARDLREFVLPDFEMLRIPQWAARAEYFGDEFHAEALWIPLPTIDEIGRRGAEFYPLAVDRDPFLGPILTIATEEKPRRRLSNTNYGLRLGAIRNGWDLAGFYYHSIDVQPTFYRTALTTLTPRHDKIDQLGATLAKDFGSFVLKGEAVYTQGRQFNVTRFAELDSVVPSDTLDWIVGADLTPFDDGRFTVQLFQRLFTDHDSDMVTDRTETGITLLLSGKPRSDIELQGLLIHSLNRSDWMFRPKLTWNVRKNWRWVFGVDLFKGPPTALFGQFDFRDRIYTDLRYSF